MKWQESHLLWSSKRAYTHIADSGALLWNTVTGTIFAQDLPLKLLPQTWAQAVVIEVFGEFSKLELAWFTSWSHCLLRVGVKCIEVTCCPLQSSHWTETLHSSFVWPVLKQRKQRFSSTMNFLFMSKGFDLNLLQVAKVCEWELCIGHISKICGLLLTDYRNSFFCIDFLSHSLGNTLSTVATCSCN